ncbi:MAG: glycosyltransferase family 4 protein [Candidatus Latescibacteria bacterium]|nr:glycosyltransferase family 4 protein [Candidatus Latescibacterota bacterium]
MRICIDARPAREVVTGLGRYASSLVSHLAALDRSNEYIVLRRAESSAPLVCQENFREVFLDYSMYSARNLLAGARAINALQPDIYHALFHFLPLGLRTRRTVVTLHDLIWVQHPLRSAGRHWRRWFKAGLAAPLIRHALARADQVITTSESTRQEVIAHYGFPPPKLTTIHLGVDQLFSGPPPETLPALGQGTPFIFSLGNTLPHKNIPRLLRAFGAIAPRYPKLRLLIAGRGDGHPTLLRLAGQLALMDRVLFRKRLSQAEIHACYGGALLFAFPSLMEGFGLPVLEAMASGCPVLAADIPPVAEVAGGDAWLVDPLDPQAIAAGLCHLLDDPGMRQELSQRGRSRAAGFTWQVCAEKTLAVYRQVLA